MTGPADFAELPPAAQMRIDATCDRFEAAWQSGNRPNLTDYLATAEPDDRPTLAAALVNLDAGYRRQAGEAPIPADYAGIATDLPTVVVAGLLGESATSAGSDRALMPTWTYVSSPTGDMPQLAGFELEAELGRGGMGVVYRARQVGLNRVVALKMILSGNLARAEEKARFLAEAESVAALHHPGVVQVYEFGTHDGRPFFALEYCPGGSLADKLAGTPLPSKEAAGLVERLARAIQAAHDVGIVHRDLKPGNVLIAADGTPKISDFGLAKRVEGGEQLTATGAILGTPSYMAPEQANGSKTVGPLTDVYALGAILYECLTGRPPFKAATPLETVLQVIDEEPAQVRRLNPTGPADLETICHKCLQKDPARRYMSAAALADDLGRWQRGEPIAARPVGNAERSWRWCRRNRALAYSLAALVALVAIGVIGLVVGLAAVTRERDVAREQKQRTRQALDTMVSEDMIDRLGTQKELTKDQKEFLRTALTYYKDFAAEAATDKEGRELVADAHFRVGYLLKALGQREDAHSAYRGALPIYEQLVADFPSVPDYRRKLASCHNHLGLLFAELGRQTEAETEYRAAVEIQGKLADEMPAVPGYQIELTRSRKNLVNLFASRNQWQTVVAEYRAIVVVQAKLAAEFPGEATYRRELGVSHSNLAVLLSQLGQPAAAEAEFRAALEVREKLVADNLSVPEYHADLGRTRNFFGALLASMPHRRPEAVAQYRGAWDEQAKLVSALPAKPDYRRDLAATHTNLGALLADLDKGAEAEAEYRAALAEQKKLTADFPDVPSYSRDLAMTHENLGNRLVGVAGRRSDAEAEHRAALDIREKLAAGHQDVAEYAIDLGNSYINHGNRLREGGDPAAAATWHTKAVNRLTPVVAAQPRLVTPRRYLCDAHRGRALDLTQLKQFTEALSDWDAALKFDDGSVPLEIRARRADCLARLGRVADVTRETDVIAADPAATAGLLCACTCSMALASAVPDNAAAGAGAARAVDLLRKSIAKGYPDIPGLLTDPDLASLRHRADYADLLWDLADTPASNVE